ncbi:MAG: ATP-binding protein [Anaerolineales bacterium]|nr:ATP-binding protein [Anaerolineales bacterium]
MSRQNENLSQLVDLAERIGVIGSPSSTTELALDILASAVTKKLVGELALFRYMQDSVDHYALGQITEISLRNIWHEDPTMRSLIRQRGKVDAVSERQDTHQGEMIVSAVFADENGKYRPSSLGTVPSTGTHIQLMDDKVLEVLLAPYKDQIFYLGHVYGSKPKLPLWFKHFDTGADGAGEAYHLGIFGKTGSGKSVLAKMIMLAYARYKQMGILVIDPQGEFSQDALGLGVLGNFQLPVKEVLTGMGKTTKVIGVQNLILDRRELFAQILYESPFFEKLSFSKGENREIAANILGDNLGKKNIKLTDLHKRESFDFAWSLLGQENIQKIFYRSDASRNRFQSVYNDAKPDEFYKEIWLPIAQLFDEARPDAQKVESILFSLFNSKNKPLVIIDLSAKGDTNLFWNETIQALVIKRLLEGIRFSAEQAYSQKQNLNTLVLMDEAHRLAPAENPDNETMKQIRNIFIDSVRTTRKYGVGWMFISQTLSSLHREIVQQLRIFFFGFGLGMGMEFQALRNLVGGRSKALDLYQLFRDPQSSFDIASREYSFMTIGPVSPLSFAGTPLFLNAFNTPSEFLRANNLQAVAQVKMNL